MNLENKCLSAKTNSYEGLSLYLNLEVGQILIYKNDIINLYVPLNDYKRVA